jgi:hypothetical protein
LRGGNAGNDQLDQPARRHPVECRRIEIAQLVRVGDVREMPRRQRRKLVAKKRFALAVDRERIQDALRNRCRRLGGRSIEGRRWDDGFRWETQRLERPPQGPFQVDRGEPRRPVLGIDTVGLRGLATGPKRLLTIHRDELDPALPSFVRHLGAARARDVRPSVFVEDGVCKLNKYFRHLRLPPSVLGLKRAKRLHRIDK